MKRKSLSHASSTTRRRKTSPKRLHHRIISHFRGNGGIYAIFILATAMAAAFALSGGILPQLNPNPPASSQVQIDENSANQSSESALQLVDIKIKKPTPTPTAAPTISPPSEKACLNRTVISLMIDLSASMANDGKIGALNTALNDFNESLRGTDAVVGGIAFGAGPAFSTDGVEGVKHLSGYTSNKDTTKERFTQLSPGGEGGTYMRNGFQVAINRIKDYKANHPDYRYVTVFFSDGVPEYQTWGNCYKELDVCWSRQQDPRKTPYSLYQQDFTSEMENISDKVYSIGIYNSASGTRGSGLTSDLQELLRTIASKNTAPYFQSIDLKSGQVRDLTSFFRTIVGDVCKPLS